MAMSDQLRATWSGCGFEAPADGDARENATGPPIGTVSRCPECEGTDVHSGR